MKQGPVLMESLLRRGLAYFHPLCSWAALSSVPRPAARTDGQRPQCPRERQGFFLVRGLMQRTKGCPEKWLHLGSSASLTVTKLRVSHTMNEASCQFSRFSLLVFGSQLQRSWVTQPSLHSQPVCFDRLHPHSLF